MTGDTTIEGVDPALLEKLRRGLELRMGPTGELSHEGEPFLHAGVERLFRQGLDLSDGGEPIVRIGTQWAYITVADCPLRVVAVDDVGGHPMLRLDDGRRLPLDPHTLWEEPARGLRCSVPSQPTGRPLPARFLNRAAVELAAWLDLEADPPELIVGTDRWTVPSSPPDPSP